MPLNNAAACKRLPAPRCLSSPAEYVAHLGQHQCPLCPRKRTLPHAIMTTRPSAAKPCAQLLAQIAFDFFFGKKSQMGGPRFATADPETLHATILNRPTPARPRQEVARNRR